MRSSIAEEIVLLILGCMMLVPVLRIGDGNLSERAEGNSFRKKYRISSR